MKHSELIDLLMELEKKYDIYSLQYRGIQYWPIMRINLGWELLKLDQLKSSSDLLENNPSIFFHITNVFSLIIKKVHSLAKNIFYIIKYSVVMDNRQSVQ